jgi:PAS domain S-box-containing protein
MLVLLDSKGIQHFVSESSEKILGYRPEELTNIDVIEEMVHPDDRKKTLEQFLEILNGNGFGGAQYRHRHKNGGWIYLEAFGSNQINNPEINAVVLNVRDITDRKIAEKKLMENEIRLQELVATKDKFFSIIAHDLRSPFNSIMGLCDLLIRQTRQKDYEGIEKYAEIIQTSAQLSMDLLVNLLDWARTQTGKMEFNPEYFEAVALIQEVTKLAEGPAQQKSISILHRLPHNLPVFADKPMLNTILRNLLSNAIKFSHLKGKIFVSAKLADNKLTVSVADEGIGISANEKNQLFRIAESHSSLGTQKEMGTGLGLILCSEFIKKHNGEIWVESGEGKGSNFFFSIPQPI